MSLVRGCGENVFLPTELYATTFHQSESTDAHKTISHSQQV